MAEGDGEPRGPLAQLGDAPLHLRGLVADWPAYRLWRGPGGLQRLAELAGEVAVQVMVGQSGGAQFVGDMQHLLLLAAPLKDFLGGALEARLAEARPAGAEGAVGLAAAPRLYLAQQPISAAPAPGQPLSPGPLHALAQDLQTPACLAGLPLAQVNLWASRSETRSSSHYDPFMNLLCVVAGTKTVRLLPPSASPWLRPQPLHHESANHSPVDLAALPPARETRLATGETRPPLQTVCLEAGDALFIPEGWWHAVDSAPGTLAVSYWWQGRVSAALGGPSDRYLLRRALQSLVEAEKAGMLASMERSAPDPEEEGAAAAAAKRRRRSEGPAAAAAAAADDAGDGAGPAPRGHYLQAGGAALVERGLRPAEAAGLAALVLALEAPAPRWEGVGAALAAVVRLGRDPLLRVLCEMAEAHPRLTASLLLERMGPESWELLSSRLEAHEAALAAEGVAAAPHLFAALYDRLYSAVPDRQRLLGVILERKLAFAELALQAVLARELGQAPPPGRPAPG